MKTKGMRLLAGLVFLMAVLSVSADAGNKVRIGTAGAQELLIPVGARGIALGGSSLVFMNGTEAIYWNPAGLGRIEHSVEGMFSQMTYFADINVTYGALGVQAGDFGTLGFTIKSLSFGDIPVTTTTYPDGTGATYSPSFLTLGATYAKLLTDRISVGVTANLVNESIMSTSASGIAFNVGIQYRNLGVQGLDLGVVVNNIGPNMTFDGPDLLQTATVANVLRPATFYKVQAAGFELPSNIEIGLGYRRQFDDKNSAVVGGMFRNNNYQDDEYNLGAEYGFDNLLFLRGGYTFSPQVDKDPTGANGYIFDFTVGAGLHYFVGGVDLAFDYAYRHMKYFDANNVITLRVGF